METPPPSDLPSKEHPFNSEAGKDAILDLTESASIIAKERFRAFYDQRLNDRQFVETAECQKRIHPGDDHIIAATRQIPTLLDGFPDESQWVKDRNRISAEPDRFAHQKDSPPKTPSEWDIFDVENAIRIIRSKDAPAGERFVAAGNLHAYTKSSEYMPSEIIATANGTQSRFSEQIDEVANRLPKDLTDREKIKNDLTILRSNLEASWWLPTQSRLNLLGEISRIYGVRADLAYSKLEDLYSS